MDSRINASSDQAGYQTGNKRPRRTLFALIILSVLLVITWRTVFADQQSLEAQTSFENNPPEFIEEIRSPSNPAPTRPGITLSAASGETITFKSQNGNTIANTPPQIREMPHLVLFRNSGLTEAEERRLIVAVNNLAVPPTGMTVTLKLETQHSSPNLGGEANNRILVWNESRRIENPGETTQTGEMVIFEVEFGELTQSNGMTITTPTDYYRYEVIIEEGNRSSRIARQSISQDYALLVERQSIAKLIFEGDAKDVGPAEIALYYGDMFPFQKDGGDDATRISRDDVPSYVQTQLLPEMIAAIHQQMSWGFNWDKAWTNPRIDEPANRLSVALTDGRTWYHGPAPVRGHSAISINVNGGNNEEYDSLADGLMSTFHHELFHSFQRSINQAKGGIGDVSGKDKAWRFFTEGTASLIPSVAQAEVQYSQSGSPRAYLAKAAKFVGGRSFSGDLNNSYAEMTPYRAAIYWRFLYEQCGGMRGEFEDPIAGMGLIRRTLEVLYAKDVVDINTSTDLVGMLPLIMDVVLSSPEGALCPFATFNQSLSHFARAIYSLQLDSGRCSTPGFPHGCGFYDPNNLYSKPFVSQLQFTSQEIIFGAEAQTYPSGIRSSFGMDFIDITLEPEMQGKSLTIEITANQQGEAKFEIQIWKLIDREDGMSPLITSPVESITPSGNYLYTIQKIETEKFDQLGVIITRLDSNESLDPNGQYTIVISSKPGN